MVVRNKNIRFMDNQLVTTTNTSTTLIDNSFPFSNMLDDGRFKVTKFTGTFVIETSNSVLYINDGTDKTVQISTGQYTGDTLASTIQTELNSVSSNWTVSHSVSDRFSINRSSGTKTLRLSETTNSMWDTLGLTGTTDEDASGDADERRVHTKEFIEVDLGTNANEVGFFGLVAPVNTTNPLSENATVTLLASNLQNWNLPARSITLQSNDFGIFAFLDDEDAKYRYWRFEFQDRQNINGAGWDFSSIYLGTYTTLANRNVNTGFSKTWVDPSKAFQAESGATYSNIRQRYLQLDSLTINYMDQSDRKNLEQIYYDFGRHKPLWISMDPLENCSTIEELTRYVYFNGDPTFNHFRNSVYSMSFSVRDAL